MFAFEVYITSVQWPLIGELAVCCVATAYSNRSKHIIQQPSAQNQIKHKSILYNEAREF